MSGLQKKQVMAALKKVYDPEIPVNLVDLGLIYDVEVADSNVKVVMTLTATGCPMHQLIADNVKAAVEALQEGITAQVEIVWEPRWTPEKISAEGRTALGME